MQEISPMLNAEMSVSTVALQVRRSAVFVAVIVGMIVATASPSSAQSRRPDQPGFECLIQPKIVVKVGTPVPGLLAEVLVDRGARVKKGDVLARLESAVEAASVALNKARAANDAAVRSARAKLEFQKRKEERAVQLSRNDHIAASAADEATTSARVAQNDLLEAEVNLKMARLELSRAEEVLKQRTIVSPIDGVVVERKLGPGEYAFDQAHLMTISQIDPLYVETFLPLSQFGKVEVGMKANVYPEQPVGGKYVATVVVVDEVFDAASATIGLRLELPNTGYLLPAGLKCQVQFTSTS
jgi:RND family efflux transporter MFP subunit